MDINRFTNRLIIDQLIDQSIISGPWLKAKRGPGPGPGPIVRERGWGVGRRPQAWGRGPLLALRAMSH